MDIVHFGKFYWPSKGGMETAVRDLAEIGAGLGHSVECVVTDAAVRAPLRETIANVEVCRYPMIAKVMSAPLSPRLFSHDIGKADILHVHLPNPMAELATLLLVRKNSNTLIAPYLHALPINQKFLGRIWCRLVTRRILDRAAVILVSNEGVVRAFPEIDRWKEKIRVLPFHASALTDREFEDSTDLRARSSTGGRMRVLALGRLVPYKGFDVLIRAWKVLHTENPQLRTISLDIVGDGPQKSALEELVRTLSMTDSISIRGACSQEEKARFLKTSHVYVAPSLNNSETFGISILEAMAHGLPVVTTDLSTGVGVLARGGRSGPVARAGDVGSLARALARILSVDDVERAKIGRENLLFCREKFSRATSANTYRILLKELF